MERSDSRTDETREARSTGTPATPPRTPDRVTATPDDPAVTAESGPVLPEPAQRTGSGTGTGTGTGSKGSAGTDRTATEPDTKDRKDHSDRTDRSVTTPDRSAPGTDHGTDRTAARPASGASAVTSESDREARKDRGDRTDRSATTPDRPGIDRADRTAREGDRSDPTTTLADKPASSGASPFATKAAGDTSSATSAAGRAGGLGAGDSQEVDRLTRRMDTAVGGFVDDPKRAVREADAVLEETATRLTRLLEERRTALRKSWHGDSTADNSAGDTEELRVALTHYRDMARQLLNI